MKVYLDNASTTKLDFEVEKAMMSFKKSHFANGSAIYKLGLEVAKNIERSRNIIAKKINADPKEIYFTSGGTESNNFAIKGIAFKNNRKKNHLVTSKIEHPSILETTGWLERQGFIVTYLSVDKEGFVDPNDVKKAINKKTLMVSIMHANNEIGTIEPIREISAICRRRGVCFHTDACQSFTKIELDVKRHSLDLVTLNAHKIHGPKGVGVLYIRKGTKMEPFLHGGGQESGFRSGTYNAEAIVGFGKAAEIAAIEDVKNMAILRDYFIQKIKNNIKDVVLNGPEKKRLCNNISLTFKTMDGKDMFSKLNKYNIFVSTGSACSSRKLTPSSVLLAIGLNPEMANRTIRITLSKYTTKEEIDFVVRSFKYIFSDKRNIL